jgi:hypothetical protein
MHPQQTRNLPGGMWQTATLLDNVDQANRKAEVRAELTKRLDVKVQTFGPGDIIEIPLSNILD